MNTLRTAVRTIAFAALLPLVARIAPLGAQRPSANEQMVVSITWLKAHLHDATTVVLHLDVSNEQFEAAHIPGARFIPYGDIVGRGMEDWATTGGVPDPAAVAATLSAAGVSDTSTIILYGRAILVGRTYVILSYLGARHVKVLDGGMSGWRAAGQRVATGPASAPPSARFTPSVKRDIIVDADWVKSRLETRGVALFDTRTPEEYAGGALHAGRVTKGHLAGAKLIDVNATQMDPHGIDFTLADIEKLRKLYADRAAPDDTIVTYCAVGNRASVTFFIARYLGYAARIYLGSYEDWARRNMPLVPGAS